MLVGPFNPNKNTKQSGPELRAATRVRVLDPSDSRSPDPNSAVPRGAPREALEQAQLLRPEACHVARHRSARVRLQRKRRSSMDHMI